MSHSTGIIRIGSGLGAGLALLALCVPAASAEPSPVNDPNRGEVASNDGILIPPVEKRWLLHGGDTRPATETGPAATPEAAPEPATVLVDDGSMELIQIALGALGGAAIAVGAAAGLSRRHHASPA